MIEICPDNSCTGCEACVQGCPKHCITMKPDKNGFMYPVIDQAHCIECHRCTTVCPNHQELKKGISAFYMGWHKDQEVLMKSSSGGAFTAIAQHVLRRGWIVFGACLDLAECKVVHVGIEQEDMLDRLRLSKYFQSMINGSFKKAEDELRKGRMVLFTGTTCQIAGLYAFLQRDYENLLTADVLCHGVTSKKVVDSFIKSKEKRYGREIKEFRFRIKSESTVWNKGGGTKVLLGFTDGTQVIEEKDKDTFFMGFNTNLFLRESCYQCRYVGSERIADLTIADFWGLNPEDVPTEQLCYGVSLILASSEKGKALIPQLEEDMVIRSADQNRAVSANRALCRHCAANKKRNAFFARLDGRDFDSLIHQYNRKRYIKIKLRKMLGDKAYEKVKKITGK